MSLEITLLNAMSGLQTSQQSLQTISNNIANVNTEGYSRKVVDQAARIIDGSGYGVEITRITRNVDDAVLKQLREETGSYSALEQKDSFLSQINQYFGRPEDNDSITHLIAELAAQFDAVAVTPETSANQYLTVNAANSEGALGDRYCADRHVFPHHDGARLLINNNPRHLVRFNA